RERRIRRHLRSKRSAGCEQQAGHEHSNGQTHKTLLLKVSIAAKETRHAEETRHNDTLAARLPANGSGLQLDDLLFNALLTFGPDRHVEHRIDGRMTAAPRDVALLRALGVWGLAANIVNITIGGGIFRLPAAAAGALGAAAPVAYVVCAIAMGLIVLCFAEAGSRVSLTGGLYAYVDLAFGPFVGFLSGVMLWAGMTAALSAVASFFADAVIALMPSPASSVARAAILVAVVAALAALNVLGVRQANRFNVAMTIAKLLPLLLLVAVGL